MRAQMGERLRQEGPVRGPKAPRDLRQSISQAGGVAVVALTLLVGTRDYLGLSIPLITSSVFGGSVVAAAFAWKLLFTAITVGTGFPGGEVTPLFVIGATLGVSLGRLLDVPTPLLAAAGFVAVFAGAAKTPLACIVMGVELFGWTPLLPLVLACGLSAAASGGHGIYARHPEPHEQFSRLSTAA